jgi:transcriptional regulator with XRE-family HTH domain
MTSGAMQLRDWIDRRGFNQVEGAKYLGISEPYMSMFLSGRRVPGRDLAVKLERLTGIPVASWSSNTSSASDESSAANGVSGRQRSA